MNLMNQKDGRFERFDFSFGKFRYRASRIEHRVVDDWRRNQ